MNEFLEKLEIGENKVKLSKEEIKSILAEHGKSVKNETDKLEAKLNKDIDNYKTTIDDLKKQIEKAPKTDEIENLKTKIADYEQKEANRIAKEKADEEDKLLTNNILDALGDKKFTSDYAKNGLVGDVKNALTMPENKGKGIKDLIEELSKDKEGIFASPNKQVELPGANEDVGSAVSKEQFDKMSYNERLQLKQDNPDLFKKLNN